MKLVLSEDESSELEAYLQARPYELVTSRIAVVEVERGAWIGSGHDDEARAEARLLLDSCTLIDVSAGVLRAAARLASETLRTLDAIHLATARMTDPDEVLVYEARLRAAMLEAGLAVATPGLAA